MKLPVPTNLMRQALQLAGWEAVLGERASEVTVRMVAFGGTFKITLGLQLVPGGMPSVQLPAGTVIAEFAGFAECSLGELVTSINAAIEHGKNDMEIEFDYWRP